MLFLSGFVLYCMTQNIQLELTIALHARYGVIRNGKAHRKVNVMVRCVVNTNRILQFVTRFTNLQLRCNANKIQRNNTFCNHFITKS